MEYDSEVQMSYGEDQQLTITPETQLLHQVKRLVKFNDS